MNAMKHPTYLQNFAMGLALSTTFAFAGGGSTGGGGSFICRGEDQSTQNEIIYSAVSQDLWEAARIYGIIESDLDEKDLSYAVLKKLGDLGATKFESDVRGALDVVLKIRSIEPVKFVSLGDSNHWLEKGDCAKGKPDFTPAAIYHLDELVYASAVWNEMDNVSRAALNVHEAIYKVLRDDYQDKDSDRTRKIVGYLFGKGSLPEITNLLPMDQFNGFSSKPYEAKVAELLGLFKKGSAEVRFSDLTEVQSNCVGIKRKYIFVGQAPERLSLVAKLETKKDKKGRITSIGDAYFKEYPKTYLTGGTRIMEGRNIISSSALPAKKSFQGGNLYFEFQWYYEEKNPILSPVYSSTEAAAFMSSTISKHDDRVFVFRKSLNGDIVIAETEAVKCKTPKKPGSWKCAELRKSSDVPGDDQLVINQLYYCPVKTLNL